ncbi:hypothetical protein D3C80_2164660 [compost metagenome]
MTSQKESEEAELRERIRQLEEEKYVKLLVRIVISLMSLTTLSVIFYQEEVGLRE